jgi:REP element-mobilizing transposase RayT
MTTTDVMQLHSAGEEPRPRFDYRGRHRYTITLEVSDEKQVFTTRERVLKALSMLREAANEHHFEVQAYSFLPSRVLMLVQGKEDTSDMKKFLSRFRSTAHDILNEELGHTLWKKTYRERVLRKGESTPSMARDMWRIPVTEGLATSPEAYDFQGSFVKWLRPGGAPMSERGGSEGHGPVYRKTGPPAGGPTEYRKSGPPRGDRPFVKKPFGSKPDFKKGGRPDFRREGPPGERKFRPVGDGPRQGGPPREGRPDFRKSGPPREGRPDFRKSGPPREGRPDFRKSGPPREGRPDFRKSGPPREGRPDFRKSGPPREGRPDFRKSGPPREGRPDFRKSGPPREGRPDFRKSGPPREGRPDFRKSGPPGAGRPFKPRRSGPRKP